MILYRKIAEIVKYRAVLGRGKKRCLEFYGFMDNYDNILNSALDTEKNAECCIDRRVDGWAHHSMISAEQGQELKSCIAKFYNKTKK